jgi:hypothetical protein
MTTSPFNSKYGFDLGEIANIEFSGVSSTNDQILVLKPDATGKFYLYPQSISSIANTSVVYPSSGSSYLKKQVFTTTMNPNQTTSFTNLTSFTFDIGSKQKLYLVSKIDLIGQGSFSGTYNYYHFTTGYNIISDINGLNNYSYRHIPGHFSHIFNKSGSTNSATITSIGPDKQFQNFTNLGSSTELSLQPKFSTITSPMDADIINNYPRVKASINSSTQGGQDDKLVLTIQAKSIQLSQNEKIDWFGSVEFFASIV